MDFPDKLIFFANCMFYVHRIPDIKNRVSSETINNFLYGVRRLEAEIMQEIPVYIHELDETILKIRGLIMFEGKKEYKIALHNNQYTITGALTDPEYQTTIRYFQDTLSVIKEDEIIFDCSKVEHINPAGIRALSSLFLDIEPGKKINIKIDEKNSWQDASFKAFTILKPEITLEMKKKSST